MIWFTVQADIRMQMARNSSSRINNNFIAHKHVKY